MLLKTPLDGAEGKGSCARPELTSVRDPLTSVHDHGYFPSLLATESSPLCVEKRQQRQRHRKICACLLWCSPTPDFIRHCRGACTVAVVTATQHIRKQSAPRAGSRVQTLTNKSISNPPTALSVWHRKTKCLALVSRKIMRLQPIGRRPRSPPPTPTLILFPQARRELASFQEHQLASSTPFRNISLEIGNAASSSSLSWCTFLNESM